MKTKYTFHKILTGSDLSRRRLPFMACETSLPGPVVWLTACGHGDEVGGMVIIQEIFKKIRKLGLSRGSLYAFPLMNPIGFEMASRQITLSKEDLNRAFPGDKNGSLAERIADKIFTTILDTGPSLVLDLHNDWMKSIPYTLLDPKPVSPDTDAFQRATDWGKTAGFPLVLDTDDIHDTLSYALLQQGIPALTIEMGESYIVNETNVKFGVSAILNILQSMNMLVEKTEWFRHPSTGKYGDTTLKFSYKPVGSSSGIIRFLVRPGDILKVGRPVARIYNAFGKLQETLSAGHEGIVLGHADSSVAYPGAHVIASGIP